MERIKGLSAKKNKELFIALKNGDTSAREDIIKGNVSLVYYTLSKYFKNINAEDYMDLGLIGLIKAVDSFDLDKDISFSAFSIRCIKNEILMELRKTNKTVSDVSLYDLVPCSSGTGDLDYMSFIPEPSDFIDELITSTSYTDIINDLFTSLTADEKEILKLFFGFYDKRYTQKEIANIYGLSQAFVSRKITQICNKLRVIAKHKCPEIGNDLEI